MRGRGETFWMNWKLSRKVSIRIAFDTDLGLLTQLEALNLPSSRPRQVSHEINPVGSFVWGQLAFHEALEF